MKILADQLIIETKRRLFTESFVRLRKCLGELNEQEIWFRPNDNSNSVGNLVLHLCGNARQWIIAGLGQQADVRERQSEFDQKAIIPTTQLLQLIEETEKELKQVIERIKMEDLTKIYPVQTFHETGTSILIHVVEHFSYHVGQITYFVKWRKDLDLGYYEGIKLA